MVKILWKKTSRSYDVKIGYVIQTQIGLCPHMTIFNNIDVSPSFDEMAEEKYKKD